VHEAAFIKQAIHHIFQNSHPVFWAGLLPSLMFSILRWSRFFGFGGRLGVSIIGDVITLWGRVTLSISIRTVELPSIQ